jgi:hypothetical protein
MITYKETMAHGVSIMKFRKIEVYLETVTSQQKVGAPIEAGGKSVGCLSDLSVPRCSDALRRIKISRAQMLASGRSSPSMVGISSETVG